MSIVSTLALMASAIIARIRPDPEPTQLDKLIAQLESDNAIVADLRAKVRDLHRQVRDLHRQFDDTLATERFRDYAVRPQPHAQMQSAQDALGQQYTQIQNRLMLGQTILGARNLGQQIDDFVCNCVPARHDMLLRG